jgi:decaprenylphospho-beta-D-erythro-pentofuranosid-2-ulose 2-reductase
MKRILIIGANSAIAEATARLYAGRGDALYLIARSQEKLDRLQQDLKVRGAAEVQNQTLDVNDINAHANMIETVFKQWPTLDLCLMAQGTLPEQKACEQSVEQMLHEISTNATSTLALLTLLANRLETQKSGTLAVITSVAGDRGRQSNYVYGAAKAMVSRFLQGLRNRLTCQGIQVIDIKPGFVDTPMTAQFPKGPLWAQPEQVAQAIVEGVDKGKHTLYTPWFWRWIMLVIKCIPEAIFKKLSL